MNRNQKGVSDVFIVHLINELGTYGIVLGGFATFLKSDFSTSKISEKVQTFQKFCHLKSPATEKYWTFDIFRAHTVETEKTTGSKSPRFFTFCRTYRSGL